MALVFAVAWTVVAGVGNELSPGRGFVAFFKDYYVYQWLSKTKVNQRYITNKALITTFFYGGMWLNRVDGGLLPCQK